MTQTLNDIVLNYGMIEHALIENGGELTPELEAMIAKHEAELGDKMDGYASFIAYLKGSIEYLKAETEQYTARAKTLSNTIDGLRERMTNAMIEVGQDKLKTAKHSYSIRTTESIKVREGLSKRDQDIIVESGAAEYVFKPSIAKIKELIPVDGEEWWDRLIDRTQRQSITIR